MSYNPNEPRDRSGKWTGGASGHNAGGGNRDVADHIKNQHLSLEFEGRQTAGSFVANQFKIKQGEKHIGNLNTEINLKDRRHVEINNVESLTGPHSFGPKHVKNLLVEIKKQFPRAETIGGARISGARLKADPKAALEETARASIKVKK